jgi:signal peptidase
MITSAARVIYKTFSFCLGLLASAVFVIAIAYTVVTHTGFQAEPVLSGSMEPTMKVGSVAFVKPIDASLVRKGDVVTFQNPDAKGMLITHRVVKVDQTDEGVIYRTKGDANQAQDPWRLKAVGTVGRLEFDVPYLGYAIVHLGVRDVRIAIFLILCAAFLLMALAAIWRPKDKNADAPLTGSSPANSDPGVRAQQGAPVEAMPGDQRARTGRFSRMKRGAGKNEVAV